MNLAAAVMALLILHWVARPPDAEHMYGHEKAEYFSAGAEGTLVCVAAVGIVGAGDHAAGTSGRPTQRHRR